MVRSALVCQVRNEWIVQEYENDKMVYTWKAIRESLAHKLLVAKGYTFEGSNGYGNSWYSY